MASSNESVKSDPGTPATSPPVKLPPEVLAWANQQFSEEEAAAGIREIRATGGLELHEFVQDLEQIVNAHDGIAQ